MNKTMANFLLTRHSIHFLHYCLVLSGLPTSCQDVGMLTILNESPRLISRCLAVVIKNVSQVGNTAQLSGRYNGKTGQGDVVERIRKVVKLVPSLLIS
jgi:hypothetical protein